MKLLQDDRMCRVWRLNNGDCRAKGKRVPTDFPLTANERRFYVNALAGTATMVKHLRDTRNISLAEAYNLLKVARAPTYRFDTGGNRYQLWGD